MNNITKLIIGCGIIALVVFVIYIQTTQNDDMTNVSWADTEEIKNCTAYRNWVDEVGFVTETLTINLSDGVVDGYFIDYVTYGNLTIKNYGTKASYYDSYYVSTFNTTIPGIEVCLPYKIKIEPQESKTYEVQIITHAGTSAERKGSLFSFSFKTNLMPIGCWMWHAHKEYYITLIY